MARKWTGEQKAQQAEKIRQWQPWQHSTGAKTIEGKARSCRNAFKGGFRQQLKELSQILRDAKQVIDAID